MVLVACSELEIIGYYDLKLLQHKCKEIPQDMKQAEMGDVTLLQPAVGFIFY